MEPSIELTDDQKKAVKGLERALKKCVDENVYFHNLYGTLIAFNGDVVAIVDDKKSTISATEGYYVTSKIKLDSWADDRHYVHLKEE